MSKARTRNGKTWEEAAADGSFRAQLRDKLVAPNFEVLLTDLRSITRRSKTCQTTVYIELDWDKKIKWLELGQVSIRAQRESRSDGVYRLQSYLNQGATDCEHDSAYAINLPIIGMQFDAMLVYYQRTHLTAWIDPNADESSFRVPMPEYNPMEHPDAISCDGKNCSQKHMIVPMEYYQPPYNAELYNAVRGKKIEISIGPAQEHESDND